MAKLQEIIEKSDQAINVGNGGNAVEEPEIIQAPRNLASLSEL